MSRLYDRIMEGIDRSWTFTQATRLADAFKQAIVIDASNVAEYYMMNNPKEEWEMLRDFPNIAPPWPDAFFEWRVPQWCNSEGRIFRPANAGARYGVYVHSSDGDFAAAWQDTTDLTDSQLFLAWGLWLSKLRAQGQLEKDLESLWYQDPKAAWAAVPESVKQRFKERMLFSRGEPFPWAWMCQAYVFTEDQSLVLFPITMQYPVQADGRAVEGEPGVGEITLGILEQMSFEQQQRALGAVSFMHVPWLATSFMHCKNVALTAVDPPEKLNRARIKRGKKPLVRYHVLDIEPMKQVLRREGQIEKTGLKQALHICRGYFAHYGDEYGRGKLFGKYSGQFWMPMHVRGSVKEGVVLKDYNVKAPKKQEPKADDEPTTTQPPRQG